MTHRAILSVNSGLHFRFGTATLRQPTMSDSIAEIIRRLARPIVPEPTDEPPVLREIPGLRAVLFDVYGTLFASASGGIGVNAAVEKEQAFEHAAIACGLDVPSSVDSADRVLAEMIERHHVEAKSRGVEYPEVDIVAVWAETLERLGLRVPDAPMLRCLATEYENRVNPIWPMPGCRETLERLRDAGIAMGLVTNAQFYTPPMFPALLGLERGELGMRGDLQFYSYEIGRAKPGRDLFERAAAALHAIGLTTDEALFVGNDLLNDVAVAADVGFRTALFAGDRRSLRKREGDDRTLGVVPDVVVTELTQLLGVVGVVRDSQR